MLDGTMVESYTKKKKKKVVAPNKAYQPEPRWRI